MIVNNDAITNVHVRVREDQKSESCVCVRVCTCSDIRGSIYCRKFMTFQSDVALYFD